MAANPTPADLKALQEKSAKIETIVTAELDKKPDNFAANNSASSFYLQKGDTAKASELADKAVALAGDNPRLEASALVTRGLIRQMTDHTPEGQQAAHNDGCGAMKLDPKNRAALELCKYTQNRSSIAPESEKWLKDGAQRMQELSQRFSALQNSRISHTAEEWESRCNQAPSKACDLVYKVIESRKAKDLSAAMGYAEGAVSASPADPMAYFQRGRLRQDAKDYNGAIVDFTKAIAKGWASDALYSVRAEALFHARRLAPALQDAEQALALNPDTDEKAYYYRGLAKLGLKAERGYRYADILADFKAAMRIAPDGGAAEFYKEIGADLEKKAAAEGAEQASAKPAAAAPAPGENSSGLPLPLAYGLLGAGALAALIFALMLARKKEVPAPVPARSATMATAPADAVGGRYLLGETLGEGGMGLVRKAWDQKLERPVAVKIPRPDYASSPEFQEGLRVEAKALMALGSHSSIVQFIDLISEGGQTYLILEFVSGKTVDEAIAKSPFKCLELPEAVRVVEQVCAALEFAHARHVIHRDLKPANIMMASEHQTVKVMDFGIARVMKDSFMRRTGTVCGTPAYMAPEQQMAGQVGVSSDLYALAICVYEMLTGRLPFKGEGQLDLKLRADYEAATKAAPLPAEIDGFFKKGLAPKPQERFQSAAELLAALRLCADKEMA